MDCDSARRLVELELEGSLEGADALALDGHARGCPGCAALRAELLAIDRILSDERLERAPEGFAAAVMSEIVRAEARRRMPEPAVIAIAATVGLGGAVYGVARTLAAGPGSHISQWLRGVLDGIGAGAASAASRIPGLDARLWDDPAAAGVLAALAAAGLIFLVVVLVRFPKQMTVEWR
jgi:anti-sigma factor RsiW